MINRRHWMASLGTAPVAAGLSATGLGTGCATTPAAAPLPQVSAGRFERLPNFSSHHVDARHVDIWFPPGYDGHKPHAVLYMHDGQMLFDPTTTWNKQAWQVDVVATPLLAAGRLRDFIIVGPHNNGAKRHAEYFPQKFLAHVPEAIRTNYVARALHGQPLSDNYLRFLVDELKPAIDARYRTLTGPADTFLMGSSMGGLISAYGLLEYPQVFGAAAALSVHWIATGQANESFPAAAAAYLNSKLPSSRNQRLYMDRGTTELDAQYVQAQR